MRGARRRAARRRGRPARAGPTLVTETKLPCCVDHWRDSSQPVNARSGARSHWARVAADTDTTIEPPVRNSGKPHSATSDTDPNRRATAPWKDSRVSGSLATSSTRACLTTTRVLKPAAATARSAMSHRRSLESTRIQRDVGSSRARSTPTTPAPAPQSMNSPAGRSCQSSRMNPAEWWRSASRDARPIAPAARAGRHASSKCLSSSGSTWASGRGRGNGWSSRAVSR